MRFRPNRLMLTAVLAVLLIACGNSKAQPRPTSTPDAGASPQTPITIEGVHATATAAATLPTIITRIPIRWVALPTPVDFGAATESDDPFAAWWDLNRHDTSVSVPHLGWTIYVGDIAGAPTQLYSTRRRLGTTPRPMSWTKAGIISDFETLLDLPIFGQPSTAAWSGSVTIDPVRGSVTESRRPFPDQVHVGAQNNGYEPVRVIDFGSPDRALVLVKPDPDLSPGFLHPNDLFLVERSGKARRLNGLAANDVQSLSGGRAFIVGSGLSIDGRPLPQIAFVRPTDGDAIVVKNPVRYASEPSESYGAPKDRVLVLAQPKPPACCDALVFDARTFTLRKVATVTKPRLRQQVYWAPQDNSGAALPDKVVIGDQLLDVKTGRLEPNVSAPTATPQPPATAPPATTSPDGRYAVTLKDVGPAQYGQPCYQIEVEDKVGNSSATIERDCLAGYPVSSRWWDGSHFEIGLACNNEGPSAKAFLLDADLGDLRALTTQGCEQYGRSFPSQDGRYFAIGGAELRVYAKSGELINSFQPPKDMSVWGVAWSPDGTQIAILTGPTNCAICPL